MKPKLVFLIGVCVLFFHRPLFAQQSNPYDPNSSMWDLENRQAERPVEVDQPAGPSTQSSSQAASNWGQIESLNILSFSDARNIDIVDLAKTAKGIEESLAELSGHSTNTSPISTSGPAEAKIEGKPKIQEKGVAIPSAQEGPQQLVDPLIEEENLGQEDQPMPDLLRFISRGDRLKRLDKSGDTASPTFEDFEQKLMEKIEEFNQAAAYDDAVQSETERLVVLDAVEFTREIRLIHALLNPPDHLHPWMKWLLYSTRVTPEMIELYYNALAKRDRIYLLAARSKGKLKIRYQNQLMDSPVYIWPDQARGRYELVMVAEPGLNAAKMAVPGQQAGPK